MKRAAFIAFVAFAVASPAMSSDVADHYAPQPSDTLEDAVANFSAYNALLAGVLDKPDLSGNDMEDIHQLTYTLEVALAKLIAESTDLAVQLEIVHQASEGDDAARLRQEAQAYLTIAEKILP